MRMYKQRRKLACPDRKKTGRQALAGFFEKIFVRLANERDFAKKELKSIQQRKSPACHWRDILRCCNEMGTLLAYKYPVFAASL
ncbi:MAG: hypothetical protein SOH59_03995 [Heyndrickxia faecalis]|uniref:Uncharacterized protein n=2 Tax=Heyndrickxia TaxID=2837504 RepID=A0A0C5C199_HEYCO|nr:MULTISPECIES: hypothetical protein [Heyndrickxia]AJO22008.1 hypothetical protein SB48_HM08orf01876 [Heyndrickxia coagulans]AKN56442.1 hypothetical protein AB434_4037 [Heyndrickxia coagulans]APB36890.1 hypothetical protein BIZ35_08715 [Heyndrickxia coagulans]ATW82437.1 hypothetical protein CIW84_05245 [Heyndrickxia coagulans]KGB29065.1 hypothetical protein IE89_13510 [Heyndrickxia coagulans]